MSINERLLSIRLLKKLQSHPEYAKALGSRFVVRQHRRA